MISSSSALNTHNLTSAKTGEGAELRDAHATRRYGVLLCLQVDQQAEDAPGASSRSLFSSGWPVQSVRALCVSWSECAITGISCGDGGVLRWPTVQPAG